MARLQRAQQRRGVPDEQRQQWLDAYRQEYNQVRPHEALGMQTPASRWRKSVRGYDPHPAPWQYREEPRVVKVGSSDDRTAALGDQLRSGRTVRGTSSTGGLSSNPKSVKDVSEQNVTHVVEIDTRRPSLHESLAGRARRLSLRVRGLAKISFPLALGVLVTKVHCSGGGAPIYFLGL
jgi:hypothetical protein